MLLLMGYIHRDFYIMNIITPILIIKLLTIDIAKHKYNPVKINHIRILRNNYNSP